MFYEHISTQKAFFFSLKIILSYIDLWDTVFKALLFMFYLNLLSNTMHMILNKILYK
jgi:hypothetical protein